MPREHSSILHPKSREAKFMGRKAHHDGKKVAMRLDKIHEKKSPLIDLILFFQEKMTDDAETYSPESVYQWIEEFIHRKDPELAAFEELRKKGKTQGRAKEECLRLLRTQEIERFRAGWDAPDLGKKDVVARVRLFNGDARLLPSFILRKYVDPNPLGHAWEIVKNEQQRTQAKAEAAASVEAAPTATATEGGAPIEGVEPTA
ncbi:putative Translation machinery-associated protein 16 [Paratrimastix pyriformis]|uniref:Translation machinery-associated protein 16 n=1 Tax=Paratrimastix pyriformis TaxID=342808 RepID=A0ABQ8URM7_9EUKA|nr:putative Translation machinery-associated protein 16 [Paratrimastix pyriformis]